MLRIIQVQPTVGKAFVYAVIVSESNDKHIAGLLKRYIESIHGEYSSIVYEEKSMLSCNMVNHLKVDFIIDANEMIADGLL